MLKEYNKLTEEIIKNDLTIDEDNLDKEIEHQPMLFFAYSELSAKAKKDLKMLKREFEITRSEKLLKIREKETEKKITESTINAMLTCDPLLIDLEREIIEKEHEIDVLTGLVRSFDQRKEALSDLVKLLAQNYFSCPNTERLLSREWAKGIGERKMNERLNQNYSKKKGK